MGCPTDVP